MQKAAKLLKKADPQLIRQLDNGKKRSLLDAYKKTFPKEKVEETEEEEYSPAPPKNKKAGKLIKESAWEDDPEKEEDGAGDETVGSSSVGKKKKKNLPEVEEESEDFEELRKVFYAYFQTHKKEKGIWLERLAHLIFRPQAERYFQEAFGQEKNTKK